MRDNALFLSKILLLKYRMMYLANFAGMIINFEIKIMLPHSSSY